MSSQDPYPSEKKEEPRVIHPDFIYVDEPQFRTEKQANQNKASDLAHSKGPLVIRLICLGGILFCALLALAFLIGSAILGFGSLLFLFRNREINRPFFKYLKYCLACVVGIFGFLVGIISPVIGFTILVLYFSRMDSNFFRTLTNRF